CPSRRSGRRTTRSSPETGCSRNEKGHPKVAFFIVSYQRSCGIDRPRCPSSALRAPSRRERGEGKTVRLMTARLSPFTGRGCRQVKGGADGAKIEPLVGNGTGSVQPRLHVGDRRGEQRLVRLGVDLVGK